MEACFFTPELLVVCFDSQCWYSNTTNIFFVVVVTVYIFLFYPLLKFSIVEKKFVKQMLTTLKSSHFTGGNLLLLGQTV